MAATICLTALLAACEPRLFQTVHVVGAGEQPLPVSLLDRTGIVTAIEPVSGGDFTDGVQAADGGLLYGWVGGACDTSTTLTFDRGPNTLRLVARTETAGDVCILVGLGRAILIRTAIPLSPDQVEVVEDQP